MSNRVEGLKTFLRGIARVQRTFQIEVGPVRASGVPAILIGVAGIILARGITSALMHNAPRLPETLGEARGLAEAMTTSGRLRS